MESLPPPLLVCRTLLLLVLILCAQGCGNSSLGLFPDEGVQPPIIVIKSPAQPIGTDNTPQFTISNLTPGSTVELFSDVCKTRVAMGISSSTSLNLTSVAVAKRRHHFHARQTDIKGNVSACSNSFADYQVSGAAFISIWQTTTPRETITLPLRLSAKYNMLVDWGDGSAKSIVTTPIDPDITHTYSSAGEHTITILGKAEAWHFNNSGDKDKILRVTQLGDLGWVNFKNAFHGCSNLSSFEGGFTNRVENMSYMFKNATNVNPNMSGWNFRSVMTFEFMFEGVTLPTSTYSDLLIAIEATSTKNDIILHGGYSKYNPTADAAWSNLVRRRDWIITDGGPE